MIPPYKNRPYSTVINPSTLPAEKALKRVAVGGVSQRAVAEAPEVYGGGELRHCHN